MINIKKGFSLVTKNVTTQMLENFFRTRPEYTGELYVGNISITTGNKENRVIDALWISEKYGVIAFDLVEGKTVLTSKKEEQDFIFDIIESKLVKYPELKRNRKLIVTPQVISYIPNPNNTEVDNNDCLVAFSDSDLVSIINKLDLWEIENKTHFYNIIISALQGISNIGNRNKRKIGNEKSKGYILENKLRPAHYTLDASQAEAVYKFEHNLQRIRGLAGSGKTVILAMKAAIMHEQQPDWLIGVTFNTRSLKQQFKELIGTIYYDRNGEEPDWKKIRIINAWGSPHDADNERGVYYDTCIEHGLEYFDFKKAESYAYRLGKSNEPILGVICQKIIDEMKGKIFIEKYDAFLVDEAQDLSETFLNLCYKRLTIEKRLIYAYDELQKLNVGSSLRNPKTFLYNEELKYDDEILDVCYRNSRPLLVTAHSLGFGIYRKGENDQNFVQFFSDSKLWKEVGYEEKDGKALVANNQITLQRTEKSSPKYLEEISNIDDLIVFKSFSNREEQSIWISNEIEKNIQEDNILHRDIMVVNPMGLTTKAEVTLIRQKLLEKGINSHIAGGFNADLFFIDDSIVLTGINRAKGNEVPMVYVINAQDCYEGFLENLDLSRKRNTLFTAITRSKAWVRVCGFGKNMDSLVEEYQTVKNKNFEMHFRYPTDDEIKNINAIHRDVSETEKKKITEETDSLDIVDKMLNLIRNGERKIEDYPKKYHKLLNSFLN